MFIFVYWLCPQSMRWPCGNMFGIWHKWQREGEGEREREGERNGERKRGRVGVRVTGKKESYVFLVLLFPPHFQRSSVLSRTWPHVLFELNMPISKSTKNYTQDDVEEWGLQEVSFWLKNHKLDSFVAEFASLQIDGQRLLVSNSIYQYSVLCPIVRWPADWLKFDDCPCHVLFDDCFLLYSKHFLSNAFLLLSFSLTSWWSQFTDCHSSLVMFGYCSHCPLHVCSQ